MKYLTTKEYQQELEKVKRENVQKKYKQSLKNEKNKYRKSFKIETSKLIAFYLFALLNAIVVYAMVQSGETAIPYHADGELCKFYSSEDIMTIISSATAFKTYQVTYHNALRLYVQSLNTIEEISNIVYGMDIPEDYQSDVFKAIMTKMG